MRTPAPLRLPLVLFALVVTTTTTTTMTLSSCIDPTLPPGAQVSCESNAGCPPGTICAGALGLCVEDSDDRSAPRLVDEPLVTPDVGNRGETFTLDVVSDEPLGRPPEVVASVGRIALPPFVLQSDVDGDDGDRRSYRLTYTAAGDEPPGVAVVAVKLVDERGNVADGLAAGTFRLDFEAPGIVESSVLAGAVAKAGTLVEVSITFDEPIVDALVFLPNLFPEVDDLLLTPPSGDPNQQVFQYLTTGNETEGTRPIFVVPYDVAGNAGGVKNGPIELSTFVEFDFTAPLPTGNFGNDITPHGANELFTIKLDFNEVLEDELFVGGDIGVDGVPKATAVLRGGDPVIDALPLDLDHDLAQDNESGTFFTQLTLSHRVRKCDTEGTYDIVIDDVIDRAGNERDGVTGGWIMVLGGVICP